MEEWKEFQRGCKFRKFKSFGHYKCEHPVRNPLFCPKTKYNSCPIVGILPQQANSRDELPQCDMGDGPCDYEKSETSKYEICRMPNNLTEKITVVWCPNCGKLKVNHFSYPQCPICGAAVEIEDDNKSFEKEGR